MTDSLPPDIEELLRFERERPPESTATLDQLRDHLRLTLGPVVGPGPGDGSPGSSEPSGDASSGASGSTSASASGAVPSGGTGGTSSVAKAVAGSTAGAGAKAIVAVAVGAFAAGGVVGARWQARGDSDATYTAPIVSVVAARAALPSLDSTDPPRPAIDVESFPTVSASAPARPSAKPAVSVELDRDPLAAERTLIDVARAGAARGRTAEALAALDNHARRFPRGSLVEEREGLRIQILLAAGRIDEARARAVRFRSSFPGSLLLPSIEAQLRTEPRDASTDGGD